MKTQLKVAIILIVIIGGAFLWVLGLNNALKIEEHKPNYIELTVISRPNEHDVILKDKNKHLYYMLVENSYTEAFKEGTIIFFSDKKPNL